MLKFAILIIFLITSLLIIYKDIIKTYLTDKYDIIHIKNLNDNYKIVPNDTSGQQFEGDNLKVYEVTRERLLPRSEEVGEKHLQIDDNESSKSYFYIQLASYKNLNTAEEKINEFKKSNNNDINNLKFSINKVEIENKGIFYRLRIGPFNNIDSTYDICKSFDIEINSCIILEEK